jgi:hypothetical protein
MRSLPQPFALRYCWLPPCRTPEPARVPTAHAGCWGAPRECRAQHPPAPGVECVIYMGTRPRRAPRGNRLSPHHSSASRARLPPWCWQLGRPRRRGFPPWGFVSNPGKNWEKKKTFKSTRPYTQRQSKAEERGVVELRGRRHGPHPRTAHQDFFRGTPCTRHTAPEHSQCRNRRRRTSRWCCDAAP